jgi:hypothetical protein
MQFGRRRWDPQPTTSAAVLLASSGEPRRRAPGSRAAAGGPVADSEGLRLAFGLPNPGLLPTRREREEQFAMVQRAVTDLEQRGCTADDQVAATRSAGAPATRIRLAASPGILCWP